MPWTLVYAHSVGAVELDQRERVPVQNKLASQDTPIPRGEQKVFIRKQGMDQEPPPDHDEFEALQRFALKGYKKQVARRRKKR